MLNRWFQVGEETIETDDNGIARNLALTPDTQYYYRLMCSGATERGSVRTLPVASDAVSRNPVSVKITATANQGTKNRARYGPDRNSITTSASQSCASSCTISIPATSGRQLIYYIDELDDGVDIVDAAAVRVCAEAKAAEPGHRGPVSLGRTAVFDPAQLVDEDVERPRRRHGRVELT